MIKWMTGAALLLCAVPTLSQAADSASTHKNPLSVHVLNTQTGTPSSGVEVMLEQKTDSGWQTLATQTTNADGRIPALYPKGETMEAGVYRVVFETGDWYERQGTETFFPEIPVPFQVESGVAHYHIPLLLSPYAYSTYRGS
ncbi:hydroxyisourate hydrolase [Kushneria sp. Sum13]|uniref:hydroxyisourate hydrolase n=1 Tax=Kushneria sp. Sum13 TaxID=3459196 RepID=UPI004045E9EE